MMVWFKVDDKFHDHPKAHRAGVAAIGLWALAGSWASDNVETYDGFVPVRALPQFDRNWKPLAKRLVDVGLWEAGEYDGERGYWFHDWQDQNPTRADVLQKRAEARDRMARVRANRRTRSGEPQQDGSREVRSTRFALPRPVPSRPDPKEKNYLEGGSHLTLPAPSVPTPPKCTAHPNGTDAPCAACARVREWRDRTEAAERDAAKRARENCPDCGGGIWLDNGRKCSHPRTRKAS